MNLSIGMLTHRSPITLSETLKSYKKNGILELIDDIFCVIQPSDKSHEEKVVCETYGVRPILESANGFMAWGIKRVFEEAKHENVLFLEYDFRCYEEKSTVKNYLNYALSCIESGEADVVRLRSLKRPGHPIQALNFKGNEYKSSEHLRQLYLCTHYLEEPHVSFPYFISLVKCENPRVYKMSSKNCVYTNNPTITSKRFFNKNILPFISFGKHLEPEIDSDWANKYDHKIYITSGLFTHVRMDGHEGKNCRCCPPKYGGICSISLECPCCRGQIYNPLPFEEDCVD